MEKEKYYGCKDFKMNGYLRLLYVFVCIYLALSALQMSYGFPLFKRASSVLQYDSVIGQPIALIY